MTGSRHANHRSTRCPRPTPEGPARDNRIAGPRTGTTRSELSAPASAGASSRHHEPGSRPATGASPSGGGRHQGVGKADWSTESDRTGRGAAHHTGPRGTPERHAAGHNQGTRTGAKQQRPPGAAKPDSAHNTQRTTAREGVPGATSNPHTTNPNQEWRGTGGVRTLTHTPQHPSQEWRVAAETRAQAHIPIPHSQARIGRLLEERTPKQTSQHPSQEWRSAAETGAQAHTPTAHTPARIGGVQAERTHQKKPPNKLARNGGAQPKPESKHTHQQRTP